MHQVHNVAYQSADGSEAQSGKVQLGMEMMTGFALQIVNTPAIGGLQGSNDELAVLGLDRHLRLANSSQIRAKPTHDPGCIALGRKSLYRIGHPHGR